MRICFRSCRRGQALVEFVFMMVMLLLLVFGLIDFGRAIYDRQIMTSLSREGANLASRGTSLSNTLAALNVSATPLNLTNNGYVVLSVVFRNSDGTVTVTQQLKGGGSAQASRVASNGTNSPPTNLPITNPVLPQPGQSLYVAEIFYDFQPVTPVGKLLDASLPNTLYDVAFF